MICYAILGHPDVYPFRVSFHHLEGFPHNRKLDKNSINGKTLSEIDDIFHMSYLLSNPTCFKGDQGTLLDVFLTNRPKEFYKSTSVETSISDFHRIIITVIKGSNPKPSQKYHTFHSYRKLDETKFRHDLNNALAGVDITLSDYKKNCSTLSNFIKNVIDCHALIKT